MRPFKYDPSLIGKLLKTYDDNYALIYADASRSPLIVPDSEYPLIGVRFDEISNVVPTAWDYDGNSKEETYGYDIIEVLQEKDVIRLNNLKLLSEALRDKKPVNWDNSGFEGHIFVKERKDDGAFVLSFREWEFEANVSNMDGLYMIG